MTLFEKLSAATSEEDVKAAYIKALGDKLRQKVYEYGFLRQ